MSLKGKIGFDSNSQKFVFSNNLETTSNNTIENTVDDNTIATAAFIALHMPTGMISPFAGATGPVGWLLCDGSEVSKTIYPKLFSVIGYTYGSPDNSNNFVLPDLRGRNIIGTGMLYPLGQKQGSENATLSASNLPSHSHTGTTSSNGAHGHSVNDPSHSHGYQDAIWSENGGPVNGPNGQNNNIGTSSSTDYDNNLYTRSETTSAAYTGVSVNSNGAHTHTFTTENTGLGTSFSIMQPSLAIYYIIKYI